MKSTKPLFSPLLYIWNKLFGRGGYDRGPGYIPPNVRNMLLIFITIIFGVTFYTMIMAFALIMVLQIVLNK